MHLTAKLIHLLPLQTGTGKNGIWKKQDIIVETDGQYPKKICISIWGDKTSGVQLIEGSELKIEFDIESREFNGRWFTDVKARSIESLNTGNPVGSPVEQVSGNEEVLPLEEDPFGSLPTGDDGFPF